MRLYYDLHIHSCLSPCADDESTPCDIVGMSKLKGLDCIAIADHNTDLNARAAEAAANRAGILLVPAIELTTAEDIHILCLFESFEKSGGLCDIIRRRGLKILNKPEIFGRQYITDENDRIIGEEKYLLPVSSGISLEEVNPIVRSLGGVAVPAHIDRQANSIIGVLGAFDYSLGFNVVESGKKVADNLPFITNSDAHTLGLINERQNFLETSARSVTAVLAALREKN